MKDGLRLLGQSSVEFYWLKGDVSTRYNIKMFRSNADHKKQLKSGFLWKGQNFMEIFDFLSSFWNRKFKPNGNYSKKTNNSLQKTCYWKNFHWNTNQKPIEHDKNQFQRQKLVTPFNTAIFHRAKKAIIIWKKKIHFINIQYHKLNLFLQVNMTSFFRKR